MLERLGWESPASPHETVFPGPNTRPSALQSRPVRKLSAIRAASCSRSCSDGAPPRPGRPAPATPGRFPVSKEGMIDLTGARKEGSNRLADGAHLQRPSITLLCRDGQRTRRGCPTSRAFREVGLFAPSIHNLKLDGAQGAGPPYPSFQLPRVPRSCVCVLCRHRAGILTSYPRHDSHQWDPLFHAPGLAVFETKDSPFASSLGFSWKLRRVPGATSHSRTGHSTGMAGGAHLQRPSITLLCRDGQRTRRGCPTSRVFREVGRLLLAPDFFVATGRRAVTVADMVARRLCCHAAHSAANR